MKILMLLTDHGYPEDIRIKKEASKLTKIGHTITLLTQKRQGEKYSQRQDGMTIYRFPFKLKNNSLNFFYHFLFSRHLPILLIPIFVLFKKYNIIHVHDLPSALSSLLITKVLKKKIIIDLHEIYPELIKASAPNKKKIKKIANLIRYYIYKFEERVVLNKATNIISVAEEQAKYFSRIRQTALPQIHVIKNTVDIAEMDKLTFVLEKKLDNQFFIITYVGGLSDHRGLETVIQAMKLVCMKRKKIKLFIVGSGSMETRLKQMSDKLNLNNNITFTGQISFISAMSHIAECHTGLIPYVSNIQTENSLPHKLFQYMYYKKPVIVSNVKAISRIVKETNCGLVFEASNHENLAKKIIEMEKIFLQNDNSLGSNGHNAVYETYNWEVDAKKLTDLYSTL